MIDASVAFMSSLAAAARPEAFKPLLNEALPPPEPALSWIIQQVTTRLQSLPALATVGEGEEPELDIQDDPAPEP